MRFLLGTIFFLVIMAILIGYANAEIVDNHFFAPNAPSLGVYHQEYLETYINRDPDLTKGYNKLIEFKFNAAINHLNKSAHNENLDRKVRAEAYTLLGYAYMNLRDTKNCLESLKKALELNPKSPLAYYFRAHEYFLNGDFKATEQNLEKAIALHPKFVSAMRMLAELYKDQGELEKSAKLYKKITEIFPSSGYFHYQYYKINNQMRKYDEAEKALQTLIKLQPKYRPNYLNLGDVYLAQGRLDEALREFDYILKQTPEESRAYEGKARVYFKKGELDKALRLANIAYNFSPGNVYVKVLISDIKAAQEKELKKNLSWAAVALGFIGIGIALAYFIVSHRRKQYVISVIQNFNHSVDEIYDIDTLTHYILNFFMDLGGSPKGIFLLFNRQNNELFGKDINGLSQEVLQSFKIFAGGDVTNWLAGLKRYIITLDEVEKDVRFEATFPTLKERLRQLGLKYLLPLRDKSTLVAIIAMDEFRARGRIIPYESDLLMPLSTTSAQALSALTFYQISVSDETTGVFNKRYFMQNLNLELKRAERYQQPLSLIIFDVDDLKRINEDFGYSQGDTILRELGGIIRKNIREGIDIGARTGGEKFSLLLPATETERAMMVAERLRRTVQDFKFSGFPDGVKRRVTISLGVATYPSQAATEKSLVERAEAALAMAKRTGKNKMCVAEQTEEPSLFMGVADITASLGTRYVSPSLLDETGFFTRGYFDERFSGEVRRSERNSKPCSLILIAPDIELSDSERNGIFSDMAKIFRANLRRGIDVPARYDRETIAVLIPEADQHKTAQIARRLKALVDKTTPIAGERRVTFSFGVSNYPNLGRTEESFMESARQALINCQARGGDKIVVATPG